MNPQLEIARQIAIEAHKGQFRRDGVTPYITHPEAVANAVSDAAKPVAWLHDVLEDCPQVTTLHLLERGVGAPNIVSIMFLTKWAGDNYEEYISRIKLDPIAREVKIADIEHNLSCNPKPEKVEKYRKALEILKGEEQIARGRV